MSAGKRSCPDMISVIVCYLLSDGAVSLVRGRTGGAGGGGRRSGGGNNEIRAETAIRKQSAKTMDTATVR